MSILSTNIVSGLAAVGLWIGPANFALSQAIPQKGSFYGELKLRDISKSGEISSFELLEKFGYMDRGGRKWEAPKGIIVNGASIPKPFWSVIGGPWSGAYKRASVIHDHFCETKSRHWKSVHRAFYDAMLDSGVGTATAKLMYFAVYRFGPRWTTTKKNFISCVSKYVPTGPLAINEYLQLSQPAQCNGTAAHSRVVYWMPRLKGSPVEITKRKSEFGDLSLKQIAKKADRELLQSLSARSADSLILGSRSIGVLARSLGLIK